MAHIHELYDFVTNALIVYEDKVLLCSHPKYGGKWIPIGGHIELDQVPDDAVLREVEEETGLEVEIMNERPDIESPGFRALWTPTFVDVHEANPPHHHIALFYLAKAKSDKYRLSEEHNELRWFCKADLEDDKYSLSPAVKYYCTKALEKLAW